MSRSRITRREFTRSAATTAAGVASIPAVLQAGLFAGAADGPERASRSPNEKLNIAIIGAGGRGGHNLRQVAGENIVALCDVDENSLRRAAEQAPQARRFRDFRQLYDELQDSEFDAVVVSTTEHTHAFATLPALHRKKHVYCFPAVCYRPSWKTTLRL